MIAANKTHQTKPTQQSTPSLTFSLTFRLTFRVLVSLVVLAGVGLLSASCGATSLEQRTYAERLEEIRTVQPPLTGYAMAPSLDSLSAAVPRPDVADMLEDAADADGLHPLVASQLRWRLAKTLADQGEHEDAQETLDAMGFVSNWQVLGPFANDNQEALQTTHSPELGASLTAAVEDGRFPGLQWQPLRAQLGRLYFATRLSPLERAGVYAATTLTAPQAQDAILWLSIEGAYKVWLNGQLVADQPAVQGSGSPDAEGFNIKLQAGQNVLLVKAATPSSSLSLMARLTAPDLAPLSLASASPDALPPCVAGTPSPIEGPLTQLKAALDTQKVLEPGAAPPSAEQAKAWAWLAFALHRTASADGSDDGLPERLILAAWQAQPGDPLVAMVAQNVLEDAARKHTLLDEALRTHPNHPWLLSARARILIDSARDDASTELEDILDRLDTAAPDALTPELLLIHYLEAQKNLGFSAYERALSLVERYPSTPEALDTAARLSRNMFDTLTLQQTLSAQLASDATNEPLRADLASLSLQQSNPERSRALLDEGLALNPASTLLHLHKAEICEVLGDTACVRDSYKQLLELTPTSATQWRRYGQWLMTHNDIPAATSALNRALELEPQNATLKQWVRYLDPEAASFEQPHVIDDLKPLLDSTYGPDVPYVYVLDQKITQVHPNGLSSTYTQTAYQVLNKDGADALQDLSVYYTPDEETLEIDLVRVTRADGTVRSTTFKRSEYHVADERYRMYYDYRNVVLSLPPVEPGDIVELRYRVSETSATNMFDDHFGDVWYLQASVPRRFARYILIAPNERTFNFRVPEMPNVETTQTTDGQMGGQTVYTVTGQNVPRVTEESGMPGFAEVAEYVHVTTFATWDDVALWYWNLAKDQWVVDADIHNAVVELTKGITDRREIVRKIHNYVVKNTRYVALEFGIHGYKPYKTSVCFRRRFGDCKDKASLIKVMLEDAGIPANIVLIRTKRNGEIDQNPPSMSIFDHAIAYVPEFDLYLDGTAEFSGTDELPAQDQGVLNLIVKNEGAYELRHSPVFPSSHSVISNTYNLHLDPALPQATLQGQVEAKGQFASDYRRRFETEDSGERARRYEDELIGEFPGASVKSVKFSDITQLEQPVSFSLEAQIPSPLKADGAGWSLYPLGRRANLTSRMANTTTRDHDVVMTYPFTIQRDITYHLPATVALAQALPPATHLKTPFGTLNLTIEQIKPGELRVRSLFSIDQMQIAAADYAAYRAFILAADLALDTPITFKKK